MAGRIIHAVDYILRRKHSCVSKTFPTQEQWSYWGSDGPVCHPDRKGHKLLKVKVRQKSLLRHCTGGGGQERILVVTNNIKHTPSISTAQYNVYHVRANRPRLSPLFLIQTRNM